MKILHLHHPLTAPLRGRKLKPNLLLLRRKFDTLHLLKHPDPALNLSGLGVLVSEPFDESLGLLDLLLLSRVGRLEDPSPGLFLLHVMIIVARIEVDFLDFDLRDPVDEMIQKVRSWETITMAPG